MVDVLYSHVGYWSRM